jgi:predicted DNA-binding transcriptional regulator YafY
MRTFVLTRLSDPELSNEHFKIPRTFNPNEYLKGAFTVFKGDADYEVVIDFDSWATDLIRGRRWHPSQEFIELPNGCSRLRLRLDSIEEMVGWVLNWGDHVTILRPKVLLERVQKIAEAIVARCAAALQKPAPSLNPLDASSKLLL